MGHGRFHTTMLDTYSHDVRSLLVTMLCKQRRVRCWDINDVENDVGFIQIDVGDDVALHYVGNDVGI